MRGVCRCLCGAALAAAAGIAWAQSTIYKSRDADGPVFSDRPMPGASAVLVQPPNVVAMPAPPSAPAPPQKADAPPYRSIAITSLSKGGTIHSNTGAFEFSVRSVPALRPGDRVRVVLDGTMLAANFRGTQLRVTEADWKHAARSDNTEHDLRVAIVDAQGAVLIASDAMSFYVQRATVGGRQR